MHTCIMTVQGWELLSDGQTFEGNKSFTRSCMAEARAPIDKHSTSLHVACKTKLACHGEHCSRQGTHGHGHRGCVMGQGHGVHVANHEHACLTKTCRCVSASGNATLCTNASTIKRHGTVLAWLVKHPMLTSQIPTSVHAHGSSSLHMHVCQTSVAQLCSAHNIIKGKQGTSSVHMHTRR